MKLAALVFAATFAIELSCASSNGWQGGGDAGNEAPDAPPSFGDAGLQTATECSTD